MPSIKKEAQEIIDNLSEEATWDEFFYDVYVKMKVNQGLKAAEEGRVYSHEEVKKRFN